MAAVCALALSFAVACGRTPKHHEELLVFGSPAAITIRGAPPAQARAAVTAVAQQLQQLEREWHPWRESALTALNHAFAAGAAAAAPPSLHALLEQSRGYYACSDGLLDPALGGLVALWGFHTSDYPITSPPPDEVALARWRAQRPTLADIEQIPDGRLRSRNSALALDFNAIAEGAAAASAAAMLSAHGIDDALISLGGDVHAHGRSAAPWRVAIRDPQAPAGDGDGVFAEVALHGGESLFSSGNYHKFRTATGGVRWPHAIDPYTGRPVTGTAAVTVLHRDPVRADAAATVLMLGGPARFAELAERMGTPCALLLTDADQLLLTSAMQARLTLHRRPRAQSRPIPTGDSCTLPPSRDPPCAPPPFAPESPEPEQASTLHRDPP